MINEVTLYAMCIMLLLLTVDRYGGLRHIMQGGFYTRAEPPPHAYEQIYNGTELDRVERANAINEVSHEQIYGIGVSMVILLVVNIIFNFWVIIYDAYKHLKLFWIRRKRIIAHRNTRISQHKVTQITFEADEKLKQMLKNFPRRPEGPEVENEEFALDVKAFMKNDEVGA